MVSKITGGPAQFLFNAFVLNKYTVEFFRCEETGFIQTEEPYWLKEAYSSAITKLDLGLVYRNQLLSERTESLLLKHFNSEKRFLDFAGGYGLFTRIMRDKGFDFYHHDPYCNNIFAEYFDLKNLKGDTKFELVTAFEVFEHMVDPLVEIERILNYSDNLLFSTELQPNQKIESSNDWWYFSPETGQHISFYNEKSLRFIAGKLGYNFYTDGSFLHLFTKKAFELNPFTEQKEPLLVRKFRRYLKKYDAKNRPVRESLLNKDWQYVKSLLSGDKE